MTDDTYFLLVHYPHDAVFIPGKWQVIRYGLNPNRPHLAPEYSEGTPYDSAEEAMVAAYAAGASRIWKTGNYCHPWWLAWEGTRRQNATPEKLAAAEVADRGFVESLEEIDFDKSYV